MMSNDKMREEFEARVKEEQGLDLTRLPHGGYRSFATHQAWWAWQASRAVQPVEEIGEVVVTKDKIGNIVSVTRQDAEGRVLSVIAESEGISLPGVLAEGYFHPLPNESDYEFHDAEQFPDGSDCPACVPAVIVRRSAVENRLAPNVAGLVEALEQIERWDGFPSTGEVWEDSGEPVSYGAAFGSNGERDFMRGVARKALAAYRKGGEE